MQKKHLTVRQANALLSRVIPKVSKLMRINKALDLLNTIEIEYDDDFEETHNEVDRNMRFHRLSYQFYKEYYELLKMGVVIKDIDEGLIDFYSLFEGREIYLCYKIGERKINYWHELNTGFGGRKPIKLLEQNREV